MLRDGEYALGGGLGLVSVACSGRVAAVSGLEKLEDGRILSVDGELDGARRDIVFRSEISWGMLVLRGLFSVSDTSLVGARSSTCSSSNLCDKELRKILS